VLPGAGMAPRWSASCSMEEGEEEVLLRQHHGRELQLELVMEEGGPLPCYNLRLRRPQQLPGLLRQRRCGQRKK